jgi:hypothetical protein
MRMWKAFLLTEKQELCKHLNFVSDSSYYANWSWMQFAKHCYTYAGQITGVAHCGFGICERHHCIPVSLCFMWACLWYVKTVLDHWPCQGYYCWMELDCLWGSLESWLHGTCLISICYALAEKGCQVSENKAFGVIVAALMQRRLNVGLFWTSLLCG